MSIGSYAQSVDPLTGRLQMSIPLGQLRANDISVPVSVYHHGSSLRVAEGENDCGLGWGLSAGGSVTRVVRGLPDEINYDSKKGWLYNNNATAIQNFTPSADDYLSDCSDETNDWNFLNGLVGSYLNDTEPDLFYINAPGLSAQFVFDANGSPRLLAHADITIEFLPSVFQPDSIAVKSNNGMVYTFGATGSGGVRESITRKSLLTDTTVINTDCRYSKKEISFVSAWRLASIASSATGTSAKFNYTALSNEAGKRYYNIDSTSFSLDTYYRVELASISLKSYTATFTWYNKLLHRVVIEESETQDKQEFQFEYKSALHSGSQVSKAFLSNIRLIGGSCLPFENYNFQYQGVQFYNSWATKPTYVDWKKNWGQDYFGYPNGDSNNKNYPTLYAHFSRSDGERLRVVPLAGVFVDTVFYGQYRGPVGSYSYGALKKVTYPTGGYAEIQYEPNTYMDNTAGLEFFGGGMRVKKLILQGGEIAYGKTIDESSDFRAIVKEYEYLNPGNSLSSGQLLSPIKLGYITQLGIRQVVDNLGEEPAILYSRVKEKVSGQGSTVYEFNIPGVFPESTNGEWKATRSRIARKPGGSCLSVGHIQNGYYTFPYPPSTNYNYKRGLLSKVTEYTESGASIREKTVTYASRTSNPSTIKGLRFERIRNIYHYGIYEILTGRMEVISQEVVKEASHEDPSKWFQSTTSYVYNANHMLESVTTTLPDNTVTTQKFKYAKDFLFSSPSATDTAAVALKALNASNRGREPVEQLTKVTLPGLAETVTGAQLILYRDFGANRVMPYYIKILPQGALLTEATMSGQSFVYDSDYRLVRTLKEYDSEGRILTEFDNKKNTVSHHYAKNPSFPVATFYNSRAQQAIYEGFEMTSSFGLTANGTGFQYPAGWTGSKAINFTNSSATLLSSATNLIQRNGNKYRVSCWVYSPQNRTVTFTAKSGGSTLGTVTLTNGTDNKWNYLEGEMTLSAGNTFTLEILTNASTSQSVSLDDIVFMPVQARIVLQTILPFKGASSATDDRGNSVKSTYDPMGRTVSVVDRNRNLLQKNEYAVKNMETPKPDPSFIPSVQQYFAGSPITFTPNGWTCDAGTTYAWEADGIAQASGPGNALTHTFTTAGQHNVKLTATSSWGVSASFPQTICVEYQFTGTITYEVTDAQGQPAGLTLDCNSGVRNISLVLPTVPSGCNFIVSWTRNGQPYDTGSVISVSGYSPSPNAVTDNYVATIALDCAAYNDCTFTQPIGYSGSVSLSVTNVPNALCN